MTVAVVNLTCTPNQNAKIHLMAMQKHQRSPQSSIKIPCQRDNT
jgi:hypothetical protein